MADEVSDQETIGEHLNPQQLRPTLIKCVLTALKFIVTKEHHLRGRRVGERVLIRNDNRRDNAIGNL